MFTFLNVEIKASTTHPAFMQECMTKWGADFRGLDEQTDTYFHSPRGRLKLRRGNIENNLTYYDRPDQAGPKSSHFNLTPISDGDSKYQLLSNALGVIREVRKKRHIWFIENVKFHLDEIDGLGNFIEIEASNRYADLSASELEAQCRHYMEELRIDHSELIDKSYSDLLSEE